MKSIFTLLISGFMICQAAAQLLSPDEFLPHNIGEEFTHHYMLVDYFEHLAEESPLVKIVPYGMTNEDRPLFVAIVTSEANHAKLEEIRLNNLKMAGIVEGDVDPSLERALVWLSFSVHGNEAAGSESSHEVIYELAKPSNTETKAWLENTVVIIDPSINPDGYSRYTHWVKGTASAYNNPDINDIEHNEPWPGGRTNHYLFDLNRDWAWQTQIESQQRMELYNDWLPHVHADLHEMGHESPYYFAPAAKPYHKFITEWQRDFQVTIGKNHAKYFDGEGWLYFTKEVFDLFYPSYGDTYPTYSGAIGMTYEQGGSRVGGRGVQLSNGETLTLRDRVDHHRTTALSTVEISHIHQDELISQFKDFYQKSAADPIGNYNSYIIKKDKSGERIKALAKLLDRQDIRYGTVSSTKRGTGLDYYDLQNKSYSAEPGDMIISAMQPKSVLTQILFDPESELEDSVTYDITAWSLPYAYGLQAYASEGKMSPDKELIFAKEANAITEAYAYMIPWQDLESVKAAAILSKYGISYRTLPTEGKYEEGTFAAGTVVITKADNRSITADMMNAIEEINSTTGASIESIASGFAISGPDLGSNRVDLMSAPKVLTILGDGVSNLSFGQVKWYFDQVLRYPLTMVDIDKLGRVDLDQYNTIILPDGWYSIPQMDEITDWVRGGGKLIAIGNPTRQLSQSDSYALTEYATSEEQSAEESANKKADLLARYNHYSEAERASISHYVPGAIFRLIVDPTHPLGFGLGERYFSLRTSSIHYPLIIDQENVIYHPKGEANEPILGFAGSKITEKLHDSVAFAVESKGSGKVIYMVDNPLFRGFWYNGLFLMGNALFQVD